MGFGFIKNFFLNKWTSLPSKENFQEQKLINFEVSFLMVKNCRWHSAANIPYCDTVSHRAMLSAKWSLGLACREEGGLWPVMSSVYTVHYLLLILKSDGFSVVSYTRYFKICILLILTYSKLHIQLNWRKLCHSCCAAWNKN